MIKIGLLKDSIRHNILTAEHQKNSNSYAKAVGEVISIDEDNNTATVVIVKGANIGEVIYNVYIQIQNGLNWFPKVNEYVDLIGYKGVYVITSSSLLDNLGKIVNTSNYGDMFADNTGGGGGNAGI